MAGRATIVEAATTGATVTRQEVAAITGLPTAETVLAVRPVPRESLRAILLGDLLVMGAPVEAAEATPRIPHTVTIGETESRQVTRTPAALAYLSGRAMAPS